MSSRLSNATVACVPATVIRHAHDRARMAGGVLHFGPGAFHRVHQAWYAQRLLARDVRWGIDAVSLHGRAVRDALAPQDCLYTLAVQDREPTLELIGAVRSVIVAPERPAAVVERFADPALRLVTLTVTEKGYCLDAAGHLDLAHADVVADLARPDAPASVLGYLVAGLRLRRRLALAPPAVVSCDNVADNGRKLGEAVVALARQTDPELAAWIEDEVRFPRTMVDSICPATTDALREDVTQRLGVVDAWPVQREAFVQWVVEDLPGLGLEPWAGVGVTFTTDVAAFERAKLRVLNGAHSTLAYLGLRAGCATVAEAMRHDELVAFVRTMLYEDVLPTLGTIDGLDLPGYVETVLRRFTNPAIVHQLAQIAWDGSQKLQFRILGTVRDALAAGRPIDRLCIPLAAWLWFVRRKVEARSPIVDPLVERLVQLGQGWSGQGQADVGRFLALREVFGDDLPADPLFRAALERGYARVREWPSRPLSA